jgi:hypothetical protein
MSKRKLIISQSLNEILLQKIQELIPEWTVITGRFPEKWRDHIADAEVIAGWKAEMSVSIAAAMLNGSRHGAQE